MPLGIVAVVAMFLAFLISGAGVIGNVPVFQTGVAGSVPAPRSNEVILKIDPPRVVYVTPPPLPDRNPLR